MQTKVLKLIAAILSMTILFSACSSDTKDVESEAVDQPQISETSSETRVITDMAGREVEIPSNPQRIYSSTPIGQYFIYAINPDKMVGWVFEPNQTAKYFMEEKYAELPVLGGNHANNKKMNPEVIAEAHPDLIITQGPDKVSENTIDGANKMQEQLGIPVVVVESSVRTIDKTLEFYGDVMNEKEVASKLVNYAKDALKIVNDTAAKIPDEEKVRVYYAENDDGFETEPQKSPHGIILDMVGCKNVAEVEEAGGTGRVAVSPEQIISWNPEMIVICPTTQGPLFDDETTENLYNKLKSDDKGIWADIDAVKNDNFYEVPVGPFNWADRPPSVNQLLGVLWCGNLVYPEYFDYNMKEKTKEFFELFYHYELKDDEYNIMLSHSIR